MTRPRFLPDDDYLSCWIVLCSGVGCCVLVGLIAWLVAIV